MKKDGWNYVGDIKYHYVNDIIHNDDGPAVISSMYKMWYKNGEAHREDGAAIEWTNGDKRWFYYKKCLGDSWRGYTQEKFEQWKKFKIFI